MVDVNVNAEVKGYGLPAGPSPVERDDKTKPQIKPVQEGTDSAKAALNDRALHGKAEEEQTKQQILRSREEVEKVVEQVQKRLEAIGGNLTVGLNEYKETQDIIVQIRDKKSDEVVRQFPSEELLKLKAKLDDVIGLLFDEKA